MWIVILSSQSGACKNTLVKKISTRKNYKISISHTTRKPRASEKNGRDYFFVDSKEFRKLIRAKKFLEYAKVFKNYYGSLRETVINRLKKGENIIFDIDWQGTKQIKKKKLKYKIITIFILPPSKHNLFKTLLKSDTNNKKITHCMMKHTKEGVMNIAHQK